MIALRNSLRFTNDRDTRAQLAEFYPPTESPAVINNKLGVSLCTYLCAYRLVDVMALVEGRTNHVGVPKHRKQGNFGDVNGKVRRSSAPL
jgi:hypothetical protein